MRAHVYSIDHRVLTLHTASGSTLLCTAIDHWVLTRMRCPERPTTCLWLFGQNATREITHPKRWASTDWRTLALQTTGSRLLDCQECSKMKYLAAQGGNPNVSSFSPKSRKISDVDWYKLMCFHSTIPANMSLAIRPRWLCTNYRAVNSTQRLL